MTIEELQAQVLELQGKYDGAMESIKQKDELLEGFKQKEEAANTKIAEYQENIMRLRDMNTEMFLKISQPIPEVKEPKNDNQPSPEETITLDDILG